MPQVKHQRPPNMITVQITTQILEERDQQDFTERIFQKGKEPPLPEPQKMNPSKTGTNQQISEQKQRQKGWQITTPSCTEKQMLQHTVNCQVQNKLIKQARRKRKSRTKKSWRIIQHWTRQRRQKELELETLH